MFGAWPGDCRRHHFVGEVIRAAATSEPRGCMVPVTQDRLFGVIPDERRRTPLYQHTATIGPSRSGIRSTSHLLDPGATRASITRPRRGPGTSFGPDSASRCERRRAIVSSASAGHDVPGGAAGGSVSKNNVRCTHANPQGTLGNTGETISSAIAVRERDLDAARCSSSSAGARSMVVRGLTCSPTTRPARPHQSRRTCRWSCTGVPGRRSAPGHRAAT